MKMKASKGFTLIELLVVIVAETFRKRRKES
ncbi:MAG TPA: type II secretion system protein [Phycisphaerales bacterium]|nr:type II secretion system protein [Phycisphaerales bacterium]